MKGILGRANSMCQEPGEVWEMVVVLNDCKALLTGG